MLFGERRPAHRRRCEIYRELPLKFGQVGWEGPPDTSLSESRGLATIHGGQVFERVDCQAEPIGHSQLRKD